MLAVALSYSRLGPLAAQTLLRSDLPQYRNYTSHAVTQQTSQDIICKACGWTLENQLHLPHLAAPARCRIIKSYFWDKVIQLIKMVGGETPHSTTEHIESCIEYVLLGRVSDEKHADPIAVGILALAWRVLYAETVSAHIDKHNVDPSRAQIKKTST